MPLRKKNPEDLAAKKALALEVIRRLKAEYPDAGCTLDYDHAWQLLVSVRLAAQCTDARVNIVVEELFAETDDGESPELETARALVQRQYAAKLAAGKRDQVAAALARRGFSHAVIREVLSDDE